MVRSSTSFAQLVRLFRQQRGLSQGQLAQATRLSRTYIYHLESGMRLNPSTRVVQSITRALALQESEQRQLYNAFPQLTGGSIDDDLAERTLLNAGHLAHLLVLNTSYPAHSLDRLWYKQSRQSSLAQHYRCFLHSRRKSSLFSPLRPWLSSFPELGKDDVKGPLPGNL